VELGEIQTVLGCWAVSPKQKATGSSPVGGMAGNPLVAGVSSLSISQGYQG